MNIGPIFDSNSEDIVQLVSNTSHHIHPNLKEGLSAASTVFYITFIFMMLFFFMVAAASEKYKPRFGHETSYTIILGIVLSLILWYTS